jgi:protein-disulfide isomerase
MASRKEQKEQARARREALERAEAQAAARKRRLSRLAAAAGVAAVVVVAAIVLSSSGGGKKGLATGTQAQSNVAAVGSLLNGLPQSGNALGAAKAPVTMDYYGDLQCPVCQAFSLGALPKVIDNYVRPGKLRIRYRALQTATQDQQTFDDQQVAALAAGKQRRLWQFVELFYREQGQEGTGYVTDSYLQGLARQVPGLDMSAWSSARSDPALRSEVQSDATAASTVGATGTPTLIVKGPKGAKALSGNVPYADAAQAIRAVSA